MSLKDRLKNAGTLLDQVGYDLREAADEIELLQQQNSAAVQSSIDLERRITVAETQIVALRQRAAQLEGQLGTLAERVSKLESLATPDDPPPPPPVPPSGLLLGVNLAPVDDWSTARPWNDLTVKLRNQWFTPDMQPWQGATTLEGYPAEVMLGAAVLGICEWDLPAKARATGAYYLQWEGDGEASIDRSECCPLGSEQTAGPSAPRAVLHAAGDSGGIRIRITRSNRDNPLRHLTLVYQGQLSDHAGMAPNWLALHEPFSVVRTMDWQRTNDSIGATAGNCRPGSWFTQAGTYGPASQGVSWQRLGQLLRAGKQLWLCLPYRCSRDYCLQLGRTLRQFEQATPAPIWCEYANELWNGGFKTSYDLVQRAGGNHSSPQRWSLAAADALERWQWFEEGLGRRTVRIVAGQMANLGVANQIAAALPPTEFDAVACAAYFNYRPASSVEQILQQSADSLRTQVVPGLRDHAQLARRLGKRFCVYEAGPHHQPGEQITAATLPTITAAHRDPRMGDVCRQLLEIARELVEGPFCWYWDIGKPHESGVWGLCEHEADVNAPKLLAAAGLPAAAAR